MRLVLLSSYVRWHGGEVVFAELAERLALRGHDVTLVCRRDSELARCAGVLGARSRVRRVEARLRGEGDPRSHLEVARALRAARADALLTNLSRDLKFGALAARLLGIPHVHRFAQVPDPAVQVSDAAPHVPQPAAQGPDPT
ncbi:MAG: glycosyltransferase, partial [Gemmatimonadetes bacterium]|nr:glycosyltransferase [Gemmatimonadota bacterium]